MAKQGSKAAKLPKGVDQTFIDGIQSMTTDSLKALIVILQVQNQDNEDFKASDAYINAQVVFDQAKCQFDLIAGPVKETTVSIKNKTKLIVERLKEKGGA